MEQIYPTVLLQLCVCLGKYTFGCNWAESTGPLYQFVPVTRRAEDSFGGERNNKDLTEQLKCSLQCCSDLLGAVAQYKKPALW